MFRSSNSGGFTDEDFGLGYIADNTNVPYRSLENDLNDALTGRNLEDFGLGAGMGSGFQMRTEIFSGDP